MSKDCKYYHRNRPLRYGKNNNSKRREKGAPTSTLIDNHNPLQNAAQHSTNNATSSADFIMDPLNFNDNSNNDSELLDTAPLNEIKISEDPAGWLSQQGNMNLDQHPHSQSLEMTPMAEHPSLAYQAQVALDSNQAQLVDSKNAELAANKDTRSQSTTTSNNNTNNSNTLDILEDSIFQDFFSNIAQTHPPATQQVATDDTQRNAPLSNHSIIIDHQNETTTTTTITNKNINLDHENNNNNTHNTGSDMNVEKLAIGKLDRWLSSNEQQNHSAWTNDIERISELTHNNSIQRNKSKQTVGMTTTMIVTNPIDGGQPVMAANQNQKQMSSENQPKETFIQPQIATTTTTGTPTTTKPELPTESQSSIPTTTSSNSSGTTTNGFTMTADGLNHQETGCSSNQKKENKQQHLFVVSSEDHEVVNSLNAVEQLHSAPQGLLNNNNKLPRSPGGATLDCNDSATRRGTETLHIKLEHSGLNAIPSSESCELNKIEDNLYVGIGDNTVDHEEEEEEEKDEQDELEGENLEQLISTIEAAHRANCNYLRSNLAQKQHQVSLFGLALPGGRMGVGQTNSVDLAGATGSAQLTEVNHENHQFRLTNSGSGSLCSGASSMSSSGLGTSNSPGSSICQVPSSASSSISSGSPLNQSNFQSSASPPGSLSPPSDQGAGSAISSIMKLVDGVSRGHEEQQQQKASIRTTTNRQPLDSKPATSEHNNKKPRLDTADDCLSSVSSDSDRNRNTTDTARSRPSIQATLATDEQRILLWQEYALLVNPSIKQVVEFAKQVPGFLALNQLDQLLLIKSGFFEIWLVTIAAMFQSGDQNNQKSNRKSSAKLITDADLTINNSNNNNYSYHDNGTLTFSDGTFLSREQLDSIFDKNFTAIAFNFSISLNELALDDTEIGLLSAIILLQPKRPGIRCTRDVAMRQTTIMKALKTKLRRSSRSIADQLPVVGTGSDKNIKSSASLSGNSSNRILKRARNPRDSRFTSLIVQLKDLEYINRIHGQYIDWLRANCSFIRLPTLFAEIFDIPSSSKSSSSAASSINDSLEDDDGACQFEELIECHPEQQEQQQLQLITIKNEDSHHQQQQQPDFTLNQITGIQQQQEPSDSEQQQQQQSINTFVNDKFEPDFFFDILPSFGESDDYKIDAADLNPTVNCLVDSSMNNSNQL